LSNDYREAIEQARSFLERLAGHGMLSVALSAFAVGLILHICVVYAVLDDGGSSGQTSAAPGVDKPAPAVVATPTPNRAADRTSCDAIRGTDYRSESERQWFLTNCRAALP
jgi:hypothetical protein